MPLSTDYKSIRTKTRCRTETRQINARIELLPRLQSQVQIFATAMQQRCHSKECTTARNQCPDNCHLPRWYAKTPIPSLVRQCHQCLQSSISITISIFQPSTPPAAPSSSSGMCRSGTSPSRAQVARQSKPHTRRSGVGPRPDPHQWPPRI